ncbi:MAG: transglutaminase domain-containing protein [Comamonadaceae bacterium]|nr:MAG: transglutaminase domain-containing protein [Comamonadaceae bacterium]
MPAAVPRPPEPGNPADWLGPTRLLDLGDPKLRIQALRITQMAHNDLQKAVAVHDYVKSLPFGCIAGFDHVPAAAVLRAGRGDCHSKGVLFVAMLRVLAIPARLRFVTLPGTFLKGIVDNPPDTITHAIGEVWLDGHWWRTDTYVADALLEGQATQLLQHQGRQLGYGVHVQGRHYWDGKSHAHGQFIDSDPASMPLGDWGVAHDPEDFYTRKADAALQVRWFGRVKWMLGAVIVNRSAEQLRQLPSPARDEA